MATALLPRRPDHDRPSLRTSPPRPGNRPSGGSNCTTSRPSRDGVLDEADFPPDSPSTPLHANAASATTLRRRASTTPARALSSAPDRPRLRAHGPSALAALRFGMGQVDAQLADRVNEEAAHYATLFYRVCGCSHGGSLRRLDQELARLTADGFPNHSPVRHARRSGQALCRRPAPPAATRADPGNAREARFGNRRFGMGPGPWATRT